MEMTRQLRNGLAIPAIGFGPGIMPYRPNRMIRSLPGSNLFRRAWVKLLGKPRARALFRASIERAFMNGFRLLDYSAAYGNGETIGEAMARCGVPRSEIFLTGRISNGAQFRGPEAVRNEFRKMLQEYRTDHVDLLMFHWPVTGRYAETWKIICDLYREGKARSIGVANCHSHHLEKLMEAGETPMVNQVEVHPLLTQKPLLAYCKGHGIVIEAYTPIARFDDRLMKLPALKKIARSHGKTPVQVVLRWHVQNGTIPVIRSLNPRRQQEDIDVFDFSLEEDEMEIIDGFNINSRLRYDPDNCDFSIL